MNPLLVIKCGVKLPGLAQTDGDYEDWIVSGMLWPHDFVVCHVYDGQTLPDVATVSAVVITGSGAMVTDELPWLKATTLWLQDAFDANLPVLGICFGHQLLAQALGGKVTDNPNGIEVGTVAMTIPATNDVLFADMPARIRVQVSHQQSVVELPVNAIRLASTAMDMNHVFRFGNRVWGIQFHPEFDRDKVKEYIRYYSARVGTELKVNPATDADEANAVLQRFTHYVLANS